MFFCFTKRKRWQRWTQTTVTLYVSNAGKKDAVCDEKEKSFNHNELAGDQNWSRRSLNLMYTWNMKRYMGFRCEAMCDILAHTQHDLRTYWLESMRKQRQIDRPRCRNSLTRVWKRYSLAPSARNGIYAQCTWYMDWCVSPIDGHISKMFSHMVTQQRWWTS